VFTDTHAHLDAKALRSDPKAILAAAHAAGVTRVVAIGCDVESSRACLALAEEHPTVWATVGLHPTYVVDDVEPAAANDMSIIDALRELARHPRCVALGEMGLDYYHPAPEGWSDALYRQRQRAIFDAQLALAADLKKNVVVHQRDRTGDACWRDIQAAVAPWRGKVRAVFHCWLHPWSEAAPLIAEGHLISFTGIATYANAPTVAACAAEATPGSFMLETDSPYLAPKPMRGQRNEPAYLHHTAHAIARLRGDSLARLAEMTEHTAASFFGFPP
jgi:TatD DNase family protein